MGGTETGKNTGSSPHVTVLVYADLMVVKRSSQAPEQ